MLDRSRLALAGFLGFLALQASMATAQIVVPNANEAIEAPGGGNAIPFNDFETSYRYQQAYLASEFQGAGGPLEIGMIAFRPDAESGGAFSLTVPSVQIDLSTTTAAPTALSATFDDNVGGDDTVVFGPGPLTISSAFTGPPSGPKDFDVRIPLDRTFRYDPSQGNLLLDVRVFDQGPGASGASWDRAERVAAPVTVRVTCFPSPCDVSDPSGFTAPNNSGVVTAFFVPEPGQGVAFLAAGLALAWLRRRRPGS